MKLFHHIAKWVKIFNPHAVNDMFDNLSTVVFNILSYYQESGVTSNN